MAIELNVLVYVLMLSFTFALTGSPSDRHQPIHAAFGASSRGDPGPPGRPGSKGAPGSPGPPGSAGLKGPVGPQGPAGDVGQKGDQGPPGPAGRRGSPGEPGADGYAGVGAIRGKKGNRGHHGNPGRLGERGDIGNIGAKGIKGKPGEKGSPCYCGHVTKTHPPRTADAVVFSAEVARVPDPGLRPLPVLVTRVMTNVGDWFRFNMSRFVTPSDGLYVFSLVSVSEGSVGVPVSLVHNGQEVAYTGRTETSVGVYPVGTNRIALSLARDDYVDVRVRPTQDGVVSSLADLFYSETRLTFLGYKLQ